MNIKSSLTIGEKIRVIRTSRNMSQERFGSKIGVSGKSVSAYENNTCIPSTKVLETIASTYKVSLIKDTNIESINLKIKDLKKHLIELETLVENTLSF